MAEQAVATTIAAIQQILDRDYSHLEWRVLDAAASGAAGDLVIHARPRDFRFRCCIDRSLEHVAARPRRLIVADIVAEAEHRLAELGASIR